MTGRWQERWADKENGRRRRVVEAWVSDEAELRSMRWTAASYGGEAFPEYPGERVYLTVDGARIVEAPHIAAIPPLGAPMPPPSAPVGRVPAGVQVGAEGTAVVTSRRLLFFGPGFTREWSFGALTGLADDARAPMTLLRMGEGPPAGVVIPPAAVKGFRLRLRLAVADAFDDRAGLVAQIDQLIAGHRQQRPVPPVPADPRRAPGSAWWSPLKASLVGAAALVLLLCVVGLFLPDPPPQPDTHDAAKVGTASPASPAGPAALTGVAVPPSTSAAATGVPATSQSTKAATKAATKPPAKPKPTVKPKSKPKPVDLCGAPRNPFGYNFCGGSHITSPDFDTCTYFSCIPAFWDGKGYMEQCDDGMVSMSGGRSGSCSRHGGNRRAVYQG